MIETNSSAFELIRQCVEVSEDCLSHVFIFFFSLDGFEEIPMESGKNS